MKKEKLIGRYSASIVRILKESAKSRITCQVLEGIDGSPEIYAADGYIMLQLTPAEYDGIVRPISKCDAGNWTMKGGEISEGSCIDCKKYFDQIVKKDASALESSGIRWKTEEKTIVPLFNRAKNTIISVNEIYFDAFRNLEMFGASENDPIVCGKDSSSIHAVFLPLRGGNIGLMTAAAAIFGGDDEFLRLQKKAHDMELLAQNYQLEASSLQYRVDELQKQLDALQAAAAAAQTVEPATAVEAAAEAFRIIPGATVTIKGAATASPVIWIVGGDAAAVKSAGARWSDKKQAFYFKVS